MTSLIKNFGFYFTRKASKVHTVDRRQEFRLRGNSPSVTDMLFRSAVVFEI